MYWWGLALAAVLVGLLLLNNRTYLFSSPLYEYSDWASNSLFVHEAKAETVIHGHYSRWNFYHPGPVLFYTYALGEVVFYDWLHAVPTPYNGQVIAESAAVTLLFSLALAVFAARLGGRRGGYAFFLPLALLFAVWHYGLARVAAPFMETWPASTPVLVFLCFVVATASVASGSGRELALAAFCGGWLVHNHVAQPLFVVPMTLLAYGGLIASCRSVAAEGRPVSRAGLLLAGWRASPRAHLVAAGVLALFILPVVVDMLHGRESNFQRILDHMHQQHEPMHKLVRSFCYFLTFGGYEGYNPSEIYFGKYSAAGMFAFVGQHWRAYGCWLAALVGGPLFLALARRKTSATLPGGGPEVPVVAEERDTFLRWFAAMTASAFALTLFWGMKQDGPMLYFNAFFNYSIYFCAALGLAAGLAAFLQALLAGRTRLARALVAVVLFAAAGVVTFRNAASFRSVTASGPDCVTLATATAEAAKATLPPGAVCYLSLEKWDAWPIATGVVLQLDRLGYQGRVNDNWHIMFGERHTFSHDPADFDHPTVHWNIVPVAVKKGSANRWPVWPEYCIDVMPISDLSPDGGKIRFAVDGNQEQFAFVGWPQTPGDWTWNDQPNGLVQFRPLPLPADNTAGVDMLIDAWSFTAPLAMTSQRIEINFCGTKLPTVFLPLAPPAEPVRVHISPDLWRAACARGFAKMLFQFVDARSPYSLGVNDDTRKLGGGFRSIEFRVAR